MQLPGVKRNVAQAAGVATVDSYATLNGTSQYFTAAHNSTFDFTGNITFSAWIRPNSTCFTAGRYCTIMSKENSWLFTISAGEFQYALMPASGIWAFRSTGVTAIPGQWQHISYATNKSTNTITLFLNGKQFITQTNSATVPNPTKVSTGALQIGSREIANPSQNFVGDIDEVRVYNTVRATEALAQADMNTWGPANNTGLVLYYDFNEGAGSALENTVTGAASATHLTAVGSPTWADVKTTTISNNRNLVAFPRSYLTSAGGFTMPTGVTSLDYLVVAGGGGGMARHGGGGGAGGLLTATNYTISSGAVLGIAVGGGGKGQNALATLSEKNGSNSILSVGGTAVATAVGGGAGNTAGGSGGGSNTSGTAAGTGTAGQGNRGGVGGSEVCAGSTSRWCGGGGGGAGGVGVAADLANNNKAGAGGVGLASALLTTSAATTLGIGQVVSSSVFFSGGGGGGTDVGGTAGTGGNGGGASGTVGSGGAVLNGTAATGGGGGGGGYNNSGGNSGGGSGGSGVILLSYALPCTVTTTTLEGGVTQVVLTSPSTEMSCTSSWTSPVGVTMVDAVIVGGGGGGGGGTSDTSGGGGGGGAGGQVKRLRSQAISASTSYSITVGKCRSPAMQVLVTTFIAAVAHHIVGNSGHCIGDFDDSGEVFVASDG